MLSMGAQSVVVTTPFAHAVAERLAGLASLDGDASAVPEALLGVCRQAE